MKKILILAALAGAAYFLMKKQETPSKPVDDPIKKTYWKVLNPGFSDTDEKKDFKPGQIFLGIRMQNDIVELYKDGQPYYKAPIYSMPNVPVLAEVPAPKPKVPIAPKNATVRLKASDVALKDPKALLAKSIYAINQGSKVYDLQNKNVGTTLKNELLGKVGKVERSSNGVYILTYQRPDKQFNKVASTAVYLFT